MVGVCSDWVKEPLVKVLLKMSGCCLCWWLLWKLGCSSRCHLTLSFRCSYIIRLIWYLWYGKDAFACRTPFLKQCRQRTSLMNDELLIQLDSVQLNRIDTWLVLTNSAPAVSAVLGVMSHWTWMWTWKRLALTSIVLLLGYLRHSPLGLRLTALDLIRFGYV